MAKVNEIQVKPQNFKTKTFLALSQPRKNQKTRLANTLANFVKKNEAKNGVLLQFSPVFEYMFSN